MDAKRHASPATSPSKRHRLSPNKRSLDPASPIPKDDVVADAMQFDLPDVQIKGLDRKVPSSRATHQRNSRTAKRRPDHLELNAESDNLNAASDAVADDVLHLPSTFGNEQSKAAPAAAASRRSVPLHLPVLRQVFLSGEQEREDNAFTALQRAKVSAASLRTGEDAVAFFALHGNTSHIKFVYCNRRDAGDQFRPYDLDVVPRKQAAAEYFTISASGVVHIAPGQPTTFMPLVDWIRESTNFNVLTTIRFFKHYIPAKAFRLWRTNVRYNLYRKQRAALTASLFLAKKSFCPSLMEINKLIYELQAIRLLNVKSQTYLAKEFVKDQVEQRGRAAKKFEEILEKLQALVGRVCADVKERARASTEGIVGGDAKNMLTVMFPAQQKNVSLVKMKEERAARLKHMRWATHEADMLGTFVRLIDYMAVENLVQLTLSTNSEFLEVLQAPRKTGLFQTTVSYGSDGALAFGLNDADVVSIVSKTIDGTISTVESVPRLLQMPTFKGMVAGAAEPNVAGTIRDSALFSETCAAIEQRVRRDFESATQIAQVFEQWREVFDFGERWDIARFRAQQPSVEEIQACMSKQTAWHTDIDRNMRPGYPVGIFHIESRKLKNQMLPLVDKAIVEMEELLLESFHDKCDSVLRLFTSRTAALGVEPTTLKAFAEHIAIQKKFKQDMANMLKLNDQVELMYDLLTNSVHKLALPSQDAVLLDELRSAKKTFAERIIVEMDRSAMRMPAMREQVDSGISKLNSEVTLVDAALSQGIFTDVQAGPGDVLVEVDRIGTALNALAEQASTLNTFQATFDIDLYPFASLADAKAKFETRREFWTLYRDWLASVAQWETAPFLTLDVEAMNNSVNRFARDIARVAKKDPSPLTSLVRAQIDEWKATMPVILDLGNKSMRTKHWEAMFAYVGHVFVQGDPLDLVKIRAINLLGHKDLIADTVATAVGEHAISTALASTRSTWEALDLSLAPYRDSNDAFVLVQLDGLIANLEDSQLTLQTMQSSRFVANFKDEVDDWVRRLTLVGNVLDSWATCQTTWTELEPIFTSPDILKQLPNEARRFADADRSWRDMMRRVARKPNVLQACSAPGVLTTLTNANNELDSLHKSLQQYLETKRIRFPRLYFLSDDEMLHMLSRTRAPADLQPSLPKVFAGLTDLRLVHAGGDIVQLVAVLGPNGEAMQLEERADIAGNIEDWLHAIDRASRRSLREHIRAAAADDRRSALVPSQAIVVADEIASTSRIERAVAQGRPALQALADQHRVDLAKMVDDADAGDAVLVAIRDRDLLAALVDADDDAGRRTTWNRHLRYYWDRADAHCIVRIGDATFRYGYEYFGQVRRLVPTPEASRCNLVVASAYAAHYGALVGGHIGAGKTATIVELSAALGAYCLVVAGSALQDSAAIGQMFAGVAQSGSLVCLDDIQRAPVDILSLIGQHAFTLQQALLASRPDFFFEGRLIALNASAGLLATISYDRPGSPPVLPDNLRAAFRPVTMSEPDPRVVAAALLARQGLVNDDDARAVAFSLSRLLSSFRLLPSAPAIGRLASLRRIIASSPARPPTASTIARAALHELGPGLSDADHGVLRAMTRKLFGVALDDDAAAVTKGDDDGVGAAVAAELAAQSWASADLGARFLRKVDDLHGALRDRRAVILVGAPASGKSLCTALAVGAMSRLASGAPVARHAISTVAVPPRLLVGQCHPATRKWTDGIVTRIVRSPDRSVIVFDGPLPDTPIVGLAADRLLTLPTGERLLAPPSVSIVFEAGSLADAAPAAIVRCAVIHFEADLVSPEALIRRWAVDYRVRFPDPVHETLVTLLLDHTSAVAAWVMASCVERVRRTSPATLTTTLLSLLDALLQPDRAGGGLASDGSAAAGTQESTARLLSMYFLFALVWSAGATCDSRSQLALSSYLRSRFAKGRSTGVPLPPEQGTLFDYYVGGADRASYQHWSQRPSAPFTYDPSVPFSSLRVATLETARAKYLLELAVSVGAHSLLVGASGVGKTSLVVDEYLGGANRDALVGVTVQLASWTTSTQVQAQVEARLETKRRGVVGPPVGKKLVVFVDDLHEAGPGPVELIRNAVGGGGGYHEHDRGLQFKRLVDCVFVGALQTSAAHDLAWHPRLLRHFHVVSWADPNEACFASVFGPIVTGVLRQAKDMEKLSEVVVTMTSTVYAALAKVAPLHGLHALHDVFQGVARIAPATLTPTVLARAWAHEMRRVFRDRFEPGTAPFQAFSAALHDQLGKKFPGAVDPSADDAALQFGDVVAGRATYGEVVGGSLDAVIGAHLERYNQAHATRPMHLVMFPEAVAHLLRIGRVLGVPGGHLVLVGPAGCGRRSLTRLAAHIAGAECVAVDLDAASEYDDDGDDDGNDPLQASIRRALEVAVVDHRRVVLLVNLEGSVDGDGGGRPVAQRTLDDVVALVTGNRERICAMYGRGAADLDDLLRRVQVNAESLGHAGLSTPDEIVDHLLGALRANLHAVVAAAAAGDALLPPALLARCTVDRLQAWSHDALVCIAQQFMRAQAARLGLSPAIEAAATRACVAVHESVVVGGAGPAAFLELVRIYLLLVQERREQQGARADRYAGGLGKLRETGAAVDQMRAALVRLQPELAQASADTAALLAVLERDQQVVGEQSFACARDTADCADVTQRVEAIRDECQRDLQAAMPALDAAVASLDTINKDDLAVVKSFANPPKLVELVMSAVCLLMGEPQTWSSAKRLLSDMQILDLLRRFDKDAISNRTMKKLQVYIDNAEFDPDNCRNVSLAATSLCSWVCAIYRYALVADQIEPKRKALQQAQDDLARAQALLAGKTDALADLQARLAALRVRYQDSLTAQANLRALVDTTGARLARAEDLVARLSGQKARWQAALDALDASARTLPGDALLAAGQITYAGALSDGARRDLLRAWVGYARDAALPVVDAQAYALAALFADPVVVRAWCASGLPPDAHSVENGVIVERARRWPLLLDPQGQGNRWVKRMGRARGLRVLTLTSAASSCAPVLEAAIRAGEPVLIEDVGAGDLDRHRRLLDAILVKQLFRKGGAGGPWHLQMGEGGAAIPYHADFRLYLTTRLLDAGLSARASALVTVVDFRLVPHVLDQHLLTIAARIERPDLDQRHAGLLRQVADGRRQLADLDDRILSLLASSAAGLLDDADLATTLSTSETMARALEADVAESEATLVQIEVAREPYRVVAERASAIYFAMCDMSSVSPMYQFPLDAFMDGFARCLDGAGRSTPPALLDDLTRAFLASASASMFAAHADLFRFLVAVHGDRRAHRLADADWDLFLGGPPSAAGTDLPAGIPACARPWMTQRAWTDVVGLSALATFQGLGQSLGTHPDAWAAYFATTTTTTMAPIPDVALRDRLTPFQRLIVAKVLRPARLLAATRQYVDEVLPATPATPPSTDDLAAGVARHGSPRVPVVLLVADDDDDPLPALLQGAVAQRVLHVALGARAQRARASALLVDARQSGAWLVVQNGHLDAAFLARAIVDEVAAADDDGAATATTAATFRLVLVAAPHAPLPAALVQRCARVAWQASSPGAHAASLDGCRRPAAARRLLAGLDAFHVAVGAATWHAPPLRTGAERRLGERAIRAHVNAADPADLDALRDTIVDVVYGGASAERTDRRRLRLLAADCFAAGDDDVPAYTAAPPDDADAAVFLRVLSSLRAPTTADRPATGDDDSSVVDDALDRCPASLALGGDGASDDPVEMVVRREAHRVARVVDAVRRSLSARPVDADLRDAIAGDDRVPAAWARALPSSPGRTASAWLADLAERASFFRGDDADAGPVWLGAFVDPRAWLEAALPVPAGASIRCCAAAAQGAGGVLVRGLHLRGASWDAAAACLTATNDAAVCHLPTVRLVVVVADASSSSPVVSTPLFRTAARMHVGVDEREDQLLGYIDLPVQSSSPADEWARRPVALFVQPD
ncbi:unnamed protein product (mitochondrion) [Plasmodiophora brassicae]|uniref:AAA+ ATPase domain-containing protein n=1 Tax=Plasmodiophora brassicae TaxID=37360 RepID=A0A3P3YL61_PLABS|nr:unnamed protein product [Plasmodiophora brassicae]